MIMAKVQKTSPAEVTKEQLIADFKVVIADAEALIRATADQGDVALSKLRSQAETSLLNAKDKLSGVQEDLLEKGKTAAKTADEYVHENPWKAIGVAAGVGLLVGLLIGKR
jgi:ElaB/YqjD/DUF883 family membrane-anchored ribosome-binding protein